MAPRTNQWLQERTWDAPTKSLAWVRAVREELERRRKWEQRAEVLAVAIRVKPTAGLARRRAASDPGVSSDTQRLSLALNVSGDVVGGTRVGRGAILWIRS